MVDYNLPLVTKQLIFQEQIEVSQKMINFGDLLNDFYNSLALQFGYICFFGVYFPLGLFFLLIADICSLALTAFAYSDHIKRSRSEDMNSIGVWNKIFNSVGYLGVIYNGLIPIYPGSGLISLFGTYNFTRDVILILILEHMLILLKALLTMAHNRLPLWVLERIKKERYLEEKHHEKIIFNYKKVTTLELQAIQSEKSNHIPQAKLGGGGVLRKLFATPGEKIAPRVVGKHLSITKNLIKNMIIANNRFANSNAQNKPDKKEFEVDEEGLIYRSKFGSEITENKYLDHSEYSVPSEPDAKRITLFNGENSLFSLTNLRSDKTKQL